MFSIRTKVSCIHLEILGYKLIQSQVLKLLIHNQHSESIFVVHAPVVQTMDSVIHRINHYPLDNSIGFASVYLPDSGLSGG